jgi:hypothetical protein
MTLLASKEHTPSKKNCQAYFSEFVVNEYKFTPRIYWEAEVYDEREQGDAGSFTRMRGRRPAGVADKQPQGKLCGCFLLRNLIE